MKREFNIGVFDSGVGGVTVLKELKKVLPKENIIYFGDNKNAPYGEKEEKEIQRLCYKISKFLVENSCKLILIACNTATAAALEYIQERVPIPVLGIVESGAKTALSKTENRKISIMATPFTVKSNVYIKEIGKLSEDIDVTQVACAPLCPMIEKNWKTQERHLEVLQNFTNQLSKEADTVLLACTHYSIIKDDIEKLLPQKFVVDPVEESAHEVHRVLEKKFLLNFKDEPGVLKFFVSKDIDGFKNIAEEFLDFHVEYIERVEL